MQEIEKPKRKVERKPISPERKAMLLENLKKARVRAAEVRQEKKAMKAAMKPKEKKTEKKASPEKKVAPAIDPRDAEILRLRNQVKTFSLQDIARKSKPKPKPKPKRPDTPPPQDVKNEMIQITETPTIIEDEATPPDPEYEKPKTIAKPTPPPASPSQPPISQQTQSPPQMTNTLPQLPPAPKPYKAFRKKKMRNY